MMVPGGAGPPNQRHQLVRLRLIGLQDHAQRASQGRRTGCTAPCRFGGQSPACSLRPPSPSQPSGALGGPSSHHCCITLLRCPLWPGGGASGGLPAREPDLHQDCPLFSFETCPPTTRAQILAASLSSFSFGSKTTMALTQLRAISSRNVALAILHGLCSHNRSGCVLKSNYCVSKAPGRPFYARHWTKSEGPLMRCQHTAESLQRALAPSPTADISA